MFRPYRYASHFFHQAWPIYQWYHRLTTQLLGSQTKRIHQKIFGLEIMNIQTCLFSKNQWKQNGPYINLSHQSKNQTPTSFYGAIFPRLLGADHRKLPWRRSQMTTRFSPKQKRGMDVHGFFRGEIAQWIQSTKSTSTLCGDDMMTYGNRLILRNRCLFGVCSFHVGKILLQNGGYALYKNEGQHLDLPTSHIFFSNPLGV